MKESSGSVPIPAELVAQFRAEALERIERLEAGWIGLGRAPDDRELAADVQRELHTLKGEARLIGFADIDLLCHKLEELLACARGHAFRVVGDLDFAVTMAFQFTRLLLRKKAGQPLGGIDLPGFVRQVDETLREAAPESARDGVTVRKVGAAPARPAEPPERLSPRTRARLAAAATTIHVESLAAAGPARERLREAFCAIAGDLAALSTVPLAARFERHVHAAAQLARDLGKQVDLALDVPDDLAVPAEAADALDVALLHAVRNAVDHGIEPPETRLAAGKGPCGSIVVRAREALRSIEVSVEDDGAGVDLEAVRRRAVELGFLRAPEAAQASEAALLEIIFGLGFTTRTAVSELSGRGVGLDAVKTAIERAGGSIGLSTLPGRGTTTLASIPQTSRLVPVQAFRAAGRDVWLAVPATWALAPGESSAEAVDPLAALGVAAPGGPPPDAVHRLRFLRGLEEIVLLAGSPAAPAEASRLCPTAEDYPVEVVAIGGQEALLIRPDRLRPARTG